MSQNETGVTWVKQQATTSDEMVFSPTANEAAMRVVKVAEARKALEKANKNAHSVFAFFRDILGRVGIDFWSKTEEAASLVRARTLALASTESHSSVPNTEASNDSIVDVKKTGTNW